jgi:hypothetical protein
MDSKNLTTTINKINKIFIIISLDQGRLSNAIIYVHIPLILIVHN